jgi:hypothetical protein
MKFGPRKINPRFSPDYWPIILVLIIAAALRLNNITQPFVDDNAWRESSVAMMAQNFYQKSWNIFYPEVNWVGPGPGYRGANFKPSAISPPSFTYSWDNMIGSGVAYQ